jgi:IS5 family transposase
MRKGMTEGKEGEPLLRERCTPLNLFDLVPPLSMALDPVLTQLDRLLDDDTLFQAVKADLAHRFPRPLRDGRPSTPIEVILRMLVVTHLYGWSYEATERWVGDSLVLRQCCRVYAEPVPDDATLLRLANFIQPATLHRLRDHVVVLARSIKVTRDRTLRLDGTVVATNIHHRTDSTLHYDGVRVLSRLVGQAKRAMQEDAVLARSAFRGRTRSAIRPMKRIMEAERQRGAPVEERRWAAYQRLLTSTTTMVQQAACVGSVLIGQGTPHGRQLATALYQVVPLGQQVMTQTTRLIF